jgi:hypothetical protein
MQYNGLLLQRYEILLWPSQHQMVKTTQKARIAGHDPNLINGLQGNWARNATQMVGWLCISHPRVVFMSQMMASNNIYS